MEHERCERERENWRGGGKTEEFSSSALLSSSLSSWSAKKKVTHSWVNLYLLEIDTVGSDSESSLETRSSTVIAVRGR